MRLWDIREKNRIFQLTGEEILVMTRWFGVLSIMAAWLISTALALEPGDEFSDCPDCPVMVVVPAGMFTMGSPTSENLRADDEGPQHSVTISKAFAVGKFEITKGQYAVFMLDTNHDPGEGCYVWRDSKFSKDVTANWSNPGYKQNDREPVACVNWNDAQSYVAWLSNKTGKHYRLLTEAEWEFAARAGTVTAFWFGETITTSQANFRGAVTDNGSSEEGSRGRTIDVGSFPPNNFGLYDIHGNITEWIEDCWNDSYTDGPRNEAARSSGDCNRRMLRGGSWQDQPMHVRSADRLRYNPDSRNSYIGFRIARALD